MKNLSAIFYFVFLFLVGIPLAFANYFFFIGGSSYTFTNNYSAQFNGSDEYILFGDILDNDGDTPMSYCLWLKPAGVSSISALGKGAESSAINGWTMLGYGYLWAYWSHGTGDRDVEYCNTAVSSGTWYHLCITYDGAGGIKFYTDGSEDTDTVVVEANLTSDTSNSNNFLLGDGPYYNSWNGVIGDVAVIPWELSSAEVTEIYNSGSEYDMTSFSAWATMKASAAALWITWEDDDLESASGVVDLTNNAYAGTAQNMTNASNKVADNP